MGTAGLMTNKHEARSVRQVVVDMAAVDTAMLRRERREIFISIELTEGTAL